MTNQRAARRPPERNRARYVWAAAVIVALGIAGGAIARRTDDPKPADPGSVQVASASIVPAGYVRRETRPTLDPGRFVGKAAVTHQIAREIPDVLDHLYCYCECDKSIGHKSLLSCYTDGHAAT